MPLLADLYGFLLVLFPVDFLAFLPGILYDHLYMLRIHSVQYIEEEFPIYLPAFRELVWEISH